MFRKDEVILKLIYLVATAGLFTGGILVDISEDQDGGGHAPVPPRAMAVTDTDTGADLSGSMHAVDMISGVQIVGTAAQSASWVQIFSDTS